jgi:hypothetical protein
MYLYISSAIVLSKYENKIYAAKTSSINVNWTLNFNEN